MLSREDAEPLVALQKQAIAVADGNPRLLEWLAAILPNDLLTEAQKQEVLDRMIAKQTEFREHILAETLLAQQSPDLREMLRLGLVFDLPVPELVFAKVCEGVENLKLHQVRAKAIGLLEVNGDLYRVPKILVELLNPEFTQEIYATAARELYRVWYQEVESSTEEKMLEIHRLALLGDEKEIAVTIAHSLAGNWRSKSRFREAIILCKNTLEVSRSSNVLNELAYCEQSLGNVGKAEEYYQQAINEDSDGDEYTKAFSFHCFGILKKAQGQIEQAIALYQQSLEITDRIGDVQGKAATLHQMAGIYAQQGQVDQAIALYQQSLEITDRIGDVQTKAATLAQMASVYMSQGLIEQAVEQYQESLEISRQVGNVQYESAILHQMAGIYAQHGQVDQAIALYQQSLEIKERIGNVQGKAMTLANMGDLLASNGDFQTAISYLQESLTILQHLKSPDAATVQSWLEQVTRKK
jgi:tetratricopeptide (TPR) repeat protein